MHNWQDITEGVTNDTNIGHQRIALIQHKSISLLKV